MEPTEHNTSKAGYILVLVLVLLGAGYALLRKTSDVPLITPVRESVIKPEVKTLVTESNPVEVVEPLPKSATEKKQILAALDRIGLKSLPIKKEGSTLLIPFRLVPQKVWCKAGDLDSIRYSTRELGKENLLVSIETLTDNQGTALRTSFDSLQNGVDHIFKIEKSATDKAYGLFICSDELKEGFCKGKTLGTRGRFNDTKAGGKSRKVPQDYIYYFQPLIVLDESIKIFQSNNFTSSHKQAVNKILKENFDVSDQEMKPAWKTSIISRSRPVEINDQQLLVRLPYNDPKCSSLPKKIR